MAGERLQELELFEHGVRGDRQQALYWRGGRRLTARAAPRMLAWHARSNGGGAPIVTDPSGREGRWDNPPLEAAVSDDLKREVKLVEDPGLIQDLADSVLVTFEATHRQLERELRTPIDLRRFRTNVHVAMDVEPFAERGWEGRTLRIGDAELDLLHPCLR